MDPYQQVQQLLRDDEQLLWHGVPDPRVWFTQADAFAIPFSLLWCGFAIFWESSVVSGGGPVFARLWGIPFVLMGLYFAFGRFFYKAYSKRRTAYAITSQRAILIGPRRFMDLPLENQPITVNRSRDGGHASVVIGNTVMLRSGGRRRPMGAQYPNTGLDLFSSNASLPFAFYDVADPDAMLQALDRARKPHIEDGLS
jgi:hypothetical protein